MKFHGITSLFRFFRNWIGSSNSAGKYLESGLPNITGYGDVGGFSSKSINYAGALYSITSHDNTNLINFHDIDASLEAIYFDASRSNPIYGKSSTVMPSSIDIPLPIYLGIHA